MRGREKRMRDFISSSVFSLILKKHLFRRLRALLDREALAADKACDLPRNHKLLPSKRICNSIIRRRGGNGSRNTQRYVVERTNAIVKRWCGGGRVRHGGYWGLEKVTVQMLLASIAANLKRRLGLTAPAFCPTG